MKTTITACRHLSMIAVVLAATAVVSHNSEADGAPPRADFLVKGETGWWQKASFRFTTRGDVRDEGIIGWIEDYTAEDGTLWSRYWFNGIQGDFETGWLPYLPEEGQEYHFEPLAQNGPYAGCGITATARIEWTWVWWVDADNVRRKLPVYVVHWTMEGRYAP